MVLKITNLHILRYLPTCWLYLLELTHSQILANLLVVPFRAPYY